MDHNPPARTAPRRVPTFFFAGLLAFSAASAALAYRWLPSSSSPAASSIEVSRSQRRGVLAFRAIRSIHGKRTTITGVVLRQPGYDPIGAGLMAAAAMVDRISGQRTTPGLQQPSPPPLTAPGRRPRSRTSRLQP